MYTRRNFEYFHELGQLVPREKYGMNSKILTNFYTTDNIKEKRSRIRLIIDFLKWRIAFDKNLFVPKVINFNYLFNLCFVFSEIVNFSQLNFQFVSNFRNHYCSFLSYR